ncbi:MAG: hypothetical protein Q9195_008192 [Heterodermia aff. obscurata]
MGWFSSSKSSPANNSDPLRELTPELRDFLDKESPLKYKTPDPPTAPASTQTPSQKPASRSVPAESLYQDGRYADLWENYKSYRTIEEASKSEQDRIVEVLDAYKQRKTDIARVALENCALEQTALDDCFSNGGIKSRMTMCRAENKAFERCYMMQNRFLRALGYLSSYDRPASVDEDIQMHADTLYQRMLEQEKAIEAAKAAGQPAPSFEPLIPKSRSQPTPSSPDYKPPSPLADESAAEKTSRPNEESSQKSGDEKDVTLTEAQRADLRKQTKAETQIAKEVAARAVQAETESEVEAAQRVSELMLSRQRGREERRKKGEATLGDTISGWLGW